MARYKALDIARWFIAKNEQMEDRIDGAGDLSLLKLLKLLYYAEGCSLALGMGSLFAEDIVAWKYGPVVEEVWQAYCEHPRELHLQEGDIASLKAISSEDAALLEEVSDVFGQYSAWGLSKKTHGETPWKEATHDGTVFNGVISRDTMTAYFKENYIN